MREWSVEARGLTIAGLRNDVGQLPIVSVHGWMDNAGSFVPMMEHLSGLIALDLPGHGRSEWRRGASYSFMEWVADLNTVIRALEIKRCHLLGHSLGAGVAAIAAAGLPGVEVLSLTLIEGLGPLTTEPADTPEALARALKSPSSGSRPRPSKDNLVEGVSVTRPGVTQALARHLVERNSVQEPDGWTFSHDPELKTPSLQRLTEAHVLEFFKRIECPVLLVEAEHGLQFPDELKLPRLAALRAYEHFRIPGQHHAHMESPREVAERIRVFHTSL